MDPLSEYLAVGISFFLSLSLFLSIYLSVPWRSAVEAEEALATDCHGKRGLENERLRRRKFAAESNRRRANGKSFLCSAGNLSRYRPRAIQWAENVTRTRHQDRPRFFPACRATVSRLFRTQDDPPHGNLTPEPPETLNTIVSIFLLDTLRISTFRLLKIFEHFPWIEHFCSGVFINMKQCILDYINIRNYVLL